METSEEDIAPRHFEGPTKRIGKGLLIVYTGNGKGKSTAAFGAAVRSLGRGFRVAVVQFIKGEWVSGELKAFERFGSQIKFLTVGEGFTWNTKDVQRDRASAEKGWSLCLELLRAKEHNLYIFDELAYVLKYRFLPIDRVLQGLKEKALHAHVIVTGRDAPTELIEAADLVTEMREIKHPYSQGIPAQPGIDY